MTRTDIKAGDTIASSGDKAIAGISGKVLVANRVTLEIESGYMNMILRLKIRRADLRGTVKVMRGETITTVET